LPSKVSRTFRRKKNVAKRIGNTKRNVTMDSSVLISYVISKKDNTINKKVVTKSTTDDRLMLTDVIYQECLKYTRGKNARVTKEEMSGKLKMIAPEIISISPVPSEKDLMKKYRIRDKNDLKILYSVDMTDSVILVTVDDDFSDIEGLKAKVMRPTEYLFEQEKVKRTTKRRK